MTTTTRRQFLQMVGAGAGLLALGSCSSPAPSGTRVPLTVGEATVDIPGVSPAAWGYNGTVPGPEIRLKAGETLRVPLSNALTQPTSIHWHGISLDNAMDGTPGLTQDPVAAGGRFDYEFVVPEAGTHWYHSHSGEQLDLGVYGALVVEPEREELAYDHEYTLLLDDWRDGVAAAAAPAPDAHSMHSAHTSDPSGSGPLRGSTARTAARVAGPAAPNFGSVAYPAMVVNARPPADPAVFDVRRGDRVRLRVVNVAADTGFRFAIAGHRLTVTHADGMPVQPVTVDALRLGMGERYDVLVEATDPGAWQIGVLPEGKAGFGRAVLRYVDAPATPAPPAGQRPAELDRRLLTYADLVGTGVEETPATGRPDRTYAVTLGDVDIAVDGLDPMAPLAAARGEWLRFTVRNRSTLWHPFHMHGHHFQLAGTAKGRGALKDTAVVPAGGAITFDMRADNPGRWMLHCHNLYHMEAGMMRTLEYR